MTHAVAIELHNWFSFRGEHRIELGPGVYAVQARMEDDPERSNGLGKSSLLNSMPFAYSGWHPARTEDGWITPGESSGGVTFHLSDGAVIRRTRKRGSATQLIFTCGAETQQGTSAQAAIFKRYGMNEADLFMAAFFKQKEMARLLTMDPASRMQLVSDWLELGPLQKAEELAGQLARKSEVELATVRDRLIQSGTEVERLEQAGLDAELVTAEVDVQACSADVRALQAEHAAAATRYALERDAAEFERLNARGLSIKNALAGLEPVQPERLVQIRKCREEDRVEQQRALAEARQVKTAGDFDGACPVAGIACPAKEQINKGSAEARALKARLDEKAREIGQVVAANEQTRAAEEARAQQIDYLERERAQLRPRALALIDAADELAKLKPGADDTGALLEAAQNRLRSAFERVARLKADRDRLELLRATQEGAAGQIATEERATKLARTSVLVYRAAQRVVAESTMSSVERGANAILADSGIDLTVRVTWAREGNGPAKACDQCGAGFPVSAKVKECPSCGAKRGKHTVEKLEIGSSNQSGANEDLAGIAIRLAASSWLRQRRQAGWSIAAIDEPFGALDQSNKRALSQHLVGMLSRPGSGFAQAFVVGHERAIMDALPNRIELIGSKEGTRFGT